MATDVVVRTPERPKLASHRLLLASLLGMTVVLATIPLLRESVYGDFFKPHARSAIADVGFVLEVVLILLLGSTASFWIVDALRTRDRQAREFEEKLHQLRRTLQSLVAFYPHGILIFDRAGALQQANPSAVLLLGQTFLSGYNILDDPDWQKGERAFALRAALQGKITTLPVWRRSSDGVKQETVLRTTLFPLFDEKKTVTHLVVLHEDITEQQSLEEQLLHAQKMESVGTLAGGVAHDFNNILQAILSNVSLIKQRGADAAALSRYADSIEQSARRAASLTDQLLTFARGGPHEMQPLNLNLCVENVSRLLAPGLGKHIHLELRLAENLYSVLGDAAQIEHALMNLALNARDAMPHGGRLIFATENLDAQSLVADRSAVRRFASSQNRLVCVSVSDTGIGMDERTRRRVFEPFFTTKPLGKGTGLGAAMVYAVVQKHNGHVDLQSAVGRGSTFRLYFPACAAAAIAPETPQTAAPRGGREQILLVDDEEQVLTSLQEGLQRLGYRVITARDGVEAVLVFEQQAGEIDLVVLDMLMPRADGLTALRGILRVNPSVKVILSTGFSDRAEIQTALAAGAKRLLRKPYSPDELAAAVREELDAPPLDKLPAPA